MIKNSYILNFHFPHYESGTVVVSILKFLLIWKGKTNFYETFTQ